LWFSGKVLFFVIACELVGTVDSMFFPWQQQSAQHRANEDLKQLGFAFLPYSEKGARSFSVFLQPR